MFPDSRTPRLFGLAPGVDFATSVVDGLRTRLSGQPPEAMARVTLFVNTRRMQRRLVEVFQDQSPALLPRIRLITDLANDPIDGDPRPPISPLRRQLELSQLIAGLLDAQPDLAPRAALFDLSDSLAKLLDEMQGEGVGPDVIAGLDITDLSGHWQRSLAFLRLIQPYFDDTTQPDTEARQRAVIEALTARWEVSPPSDPIIVAGSTGSRGATGLFLRAVAALPQGAVILPGFDFGMPSSTWDSLGNALTSEDHPQSRFHKLTHALGVTPGDVATWSDQPAPDAARNALVSLSLRPAPVTNQWRIEGPDLGDMQAATQGITLIEAPNARIEAEAIALKLREAIERGVTAALITPDRMLTRQVASALDRWDITPDDSAGQPLALSPPGRFLRLTAGLIGEQLTSEALLSLLKHPLCNSGDDRDGHLLNARDLELFIRRKSIPFPGAEALTAWAIKTSERHPGRMAWVQWLNEAVMPLADIAALPLPDMVGRHLTASDAIAAGPSQVGTGGLWDEAAGREALSVCGELRAQAEAGGTLSPADYRALFNKVLATGMVRNPDAGHPGIVIWGKMEARVGGPELTILAGLNDGTWPEAPDPDPWLNRKMRLDAGLLLPERRIGLSAHDYTQAIAGREVCISRSLRSSDSATVPSRWLNRLQNLVTGLPDQQGPQAWATMRARGGVYVATALARSDVARSPAAPRPSPQPPITARPTTLSVTAIARLIRDPYALYAQRVLRLFPLDPLVPTTDPALRGIVTHKVFEEFIKRDIDPDNPDARDTLMQIARHIIEADCPWPTIRHMWLSRIDKIADWFLATEITRRARATPGAHLEIKGEHELHGLGVTLTGIADRIDVAEDGRVLIYDYKTGTPPSEKSQGVFEKQLLLEAAMAEVGAFEALGPREAAAAAYIGLGSKPVQTPAPLDAHPPAVTLAQLRDLLARWQEIDRGYTAKIAPQYIGFPGDYDHLARFGEWDLTDDPKSERVT